MVRGGREEALKKIPQVTKEEVAAAGGAASAPDGPAEEGGGSEVPAEAAGGAGTAVQGEAKALLEEEDGINVSKARQISDIYRRAIRKGKEKPRRVVFMKKQFSGAPRKKSGRKFRVVDKRGKKDMRNDKFRSKGHS